MPQDPISQRADAAYAVARQVFHSTLSPTEGANKIHSDSGMNVNSARDHIYVYKHLRLGLEFQRGLSSSDIDYYLSKIKVDEGSQSLQLALYSLWRHIKYYEGIRKVTLHTLRSVAARHTEKSLVAPAVEEVEKDFAAAVDAARKGDAEARRKRLALAEKVPQRLPVVVLAYARNPDVVAEVLERAKGICERCMKPAPFLRRQDKSPYLEVHHKKQLADDGEDSVENAIALCPNCHRESHYGASAAQPFHREGGQSLSPLAAPHVKR